MEFGPVCVDTSRKSNSMVRIGEVGCQKEVEWVSFMLNWKCSENIQSLQNPPLNSNLNLEKQKAHLKASYWSIYQLPLSRLLLKLFFFFTKVFKYSKIKPLLQPQPNSHLGASCLPQEAEEPLGLLFPNCHGCPEANELVTWQLEPPKLFSSLTLTQYSSLVFIRNSLWVPEQWASWLLTHNIYFNTRE